MSNEPVDDALSQRLSKLDVDPDERIEALSDCCPEDSQITNRHDVFSALASPKRLRLLAVMAERECCTCELQAILDYPQSTVSTHLSRLYETGLVDRRRDGRWHYYRLADGAEDLLAAADAIRCV
jgi:ArsR family transcriptional regulator